MNLDLDSSVSVTAQYLWLYWVYELNVLPAKHIPQCYIHPQGNTCYCSSMDSCNAFGCMYKEHSCGVHVRGFSFGGIQVVSIVGLRARVA